MQVPDGPALSLWKSMQNFNEPWCLGAKTIAQARYKLTGSITSSWSISCIPFVVNALTYGVDLCRGLWSGRISLDLSLVWCFAVLIIPRCPSYISFKLGSNYRNLSLWALYLSEMIISSFQYSVSLASSSCVTRSWFAICWSFPTWHWKWTALILSQNGRLEMYGEGTSHLLCVMCEGGLKHVKLWWWFARNSGAFLGLRTMELNNLFVNASIMPKTIVHAYVLSHYNTGWICTSFRASVAPKTIPFSAGRICTYLATAPRRGASSSVINTSNPSSVSLGSELSWDYMGLSFAR